MDTHELRTAAMAVYAATHKEAADDLHEKLMWAADKIDQLSSQLEESKARESTKTTD